MKNVLATIGALAIVFALIGAGVAWAMVNRGFSALDEPSAMEATLAKVMRAASTPARISQLKSSEPESAALLAEARHHWADHCAGCHANDGSGDTPVGKHLYPRAPDMRSATTQQLTDGELYSVIQNGIRLTGMPAWGKRDDEHDRESWALVAFIRYLPKLTSEDLKQLKQMNPKSVEELREELEEEKFLEGSDSQPTKGPP